jgi:Tol biopolymer transport system component
MVYHREIGGDWPPFRRAYTRSAGFGLLRTGLFPQWSPDGKRFMSNSARLGLERQSVLTMQPDGSQRSILFDDPTHSALAPVWSPLGDRIAFGLGRFFSLVRGFAPADIAVLDVQARKLEVLTDGTRNLGFPSWSPDGERLVYRSWREDGSALFVMDVRTKQSEPLLSGFGRVNFPSWQPNGNLVQFTSDRGDLNYDIYTIDVDSKRVTRLTDHPGVDGHASWSPDGRWLAFASTRQGFKDEGALHPKNPQGSGDVYVMRADGSDVRALTDNQYEEATPAWAPPAATAQR